MSKFFKMIPGYNNYLVSENGEVYSIKSKKYIKPRINENNYLIIDLYKNNLRKTYKLHRLVAQAFLDNPDNLPQVNHKDCNKLNNNIRNLEWCTASQNTKHAWENGLKENTRKAIRRLGKINIKYAQKARIKHLDNNLKELFDDIFINKLSNKNICKKYNLFSSYVSQIKNKRFLKTALNEYEKSNLFQAWDLYFNNK